MSVFPSQPYLFPPLLLHGHHRSTTTYPSCSSSQPRCPRHLPPAAATGWRGGGWSGAHLQLGGRRLTDGSAGDRRQGGMHLRLGGRPCSCQRRRRLRNLSTRYYSIDAPLPRSLLLNLAPARPLQLPASRSTMTPSRPEVEEGEDGVAERPWPPAHASAGAATGSRDGTGDPPHLPNTAHIISSTPGRDEPPPLLADVGNVPLLLT